MPRFLYHVSGRIDGPVAKLFIPRVPASTACGEDERTPRICFADSIENCIKSIGLDLDIQQYITVYMLDTTALQPENLVTPRELIAKELVPDVADTNEHWVLSPCTLVPVFYEILDYEWSHTEWKLTSLVLKQVDYAQIAGKPFAGANPFGQPI